LAALVEATLFSIFFRRSLIRLGLLLGRLGAAWPSLSSERNDPESPRCPACAASPRCGRIHDQNQVRQEGHARDQGEGPVQPGGPRPAHGSRKGRGPRLRRRGVTNWREWSDPRRRSCRATPLVEQKKPGRPFDGEPGRPAWSCARRYFVAHAMRASMASAKRAT